MAEFKKKIKHIENPINLAELESMKAFVAATRASAKGKELFEEKIINIKETPAKGANLDELLKEDVTLKTEGLSFEISNSDIEEIFRRLISVTTNPHTVTECLKDLDQSLGTILQENNIQFKEDDLPQFLIAGKGNYVPGPPPEDYLPKKKAGLLPKLLQERERKNGINVEDDLSKFVGFIENKKADTFVASGHIFGEDKQISRLLLHGSLSHRLIFDALCAAQASGKLDLKYGDGKELTPKQLLELLVRTQLMLDGERISGLWELTFDTVTDSMFAPGASYDYFDENYYSFSCRSPFVLNSLLLGLGKELGLSNLQHYLLDSHWKAAYEMVHRIKHTMPSADIPDHAIYTHCMEALSGAGERNDLNEVVVNFPFTLPVEVAQKDPSYEPFNAAEPVEGIVKKTKKPFETGEYASWQEFYDHLGKPYIHIPVEKEKLNITSSQQLIETLNDLDQKEERLALLQTLGEDKVTKLFPSFTDLVVNINKLIYDHRKKDAANDLLNFLGDDVVLRVNENEGTRMSRKKEQISYHKFEPWFGIYTLDEFKKYLANEMQSLLRQNDFFIINITSLDTEKGASVKFKAFDDAWSIVSRHLPYPFIGSEDSDEMAEKIFKALVVPGKETITIKTQFCTPPSFNKPDLQKQQQKIADQQTENLLATLDSGKISADDKSILMQAAHQTENKVLSKKLASDGFEADAAKKVPAELSANFSKLFQPAAQTQQGSNAEKQPENPAPSKNIPTAKT